MIEWLSARPGILMALNCCLGPAVVFGLGVFVGRYRPRLRSPFTLERELEDMDERY